MVQRPARTSWAKCVGCRPVLGKIVCLGAVTEEPEARRTAVVRLDPRAGSSTKPELGARGQFVRGHGLHRDSARRGLGDR